jgi:hypothetical protein
MPSTPSFPFLTTYDPPGTSEGTLDPLGLYQIADQLAVQLVPAVRERMRRIRFLTAMAVGALVTEGMEDDPKFRDASPYLVWEWLVVEAIVRQMADENDVGGVPGRHMARRAIDQHGYLDARSYLKTPRIFGFHGIYKRLAVHLGLLDVHLSPGPNTEQLADAWARGQGFAGLGNAKSIISRWQEALRRGLVEKPPRTRPAWTGEKWAELAQAFAPATARTKEKRCLAGLLLESKDRPLGALPAIWQLQDGYDDDQFREEELHDRLEKRHPSYKPLLDAIRSYESFARSLQDAFDVLKAEAARPDAQGFVVTEIASDKDFKRSVTGLHRRFENAHHALGEVAITSVSIRNLFTERFQRFAEPLDPGACARALCEHHLKIQQGKSVDGKRAWFDRLDSDRIYIRHAYRETRRDIAPDHYLHEYRGRPIGRFRADLS